MMWQTIIHLTFLVSAIAIAAADRVLGSGTTRSTRPERGATMTIIRQNDFIQSIADALQYISYYHPKDYIDHLARAYEREQSPAAKDAIAQILTNSRMCAEGHRPICQDTGIVNVFLKIGMDVRWEAKLADRRHGERGRAARLPGPGQQAARVDRRRPALQRARTRATTRRR